jgi:hypothetical protein
MAAIVECAKAIKAVGSENGTDEMKQLQHLTEKAITMNAAVTGKRLWQPTEHAQKTVPPTTAAEKPCQETSDSNQRVIQSMGAPTQQVQRVPTAASPRVEKKRVDSNQAGKKKAKQRRKRRPAVR